MFESLQMNHRRTAAERLLALLISACLHVTMIALLVLLPLLFFRMMPGSELITFLLAPPSAPVLPVVPPPDRHASAAQHQALIHQEVFWMHNFEPDAVPRGVPVPGDESPVVGVSLGVYGSGLGISGLSGLTGLGLPAGLVAAAPPPIVPPPPRPQRPSVVRVGGAVQEAKLIHRVLPIYPMVLTRARISGEVKLEVLIDEEGNVAEVKVLSGHLLLVEEAVHAVKQWKYSPTLLNGKPVSVLSTVTVIFLLK